jgi:ribose transport system substrate-binding protein
MMCSKVRRLALAALACTCLAIPIVACSSSSSTSSGTLGTAISASAPGAAATGIDATLAQAQDPVSFTPPGPPLKVGASLKGKSLWYVEITSTPQLEVYASALSSASRLLGMSFHECNAMGTPTGASGCLDQARQSGAAAVVGEGIAENLAGPALTRLYGAGIPVVYADNGLPSIAGAPKPSKLLAYVTSNQDLTNRLALLYLLKTVPGKATILFPYPVGVQIADAALVSVQQDVSTYCPDCKLVPLPLDLTEPQNWASAIDSALIRNPQVNAIAEFSDSFDTATLQALRTTGKKLPVASGSAKLAGLQNVASGAVTADPGTSSYAQGWAYMDQAIRMILGKPTVSNYILPVRLFTKSNVAGLSLTPAAYGTGEWFGLDPESLYAKNWGVSAS